MQESGSEAIATICVSLKTGRCAGGSDLRYSEILSVTGGAAANADAAVDKARKIQPIRMMHHRVRIARGFGWLI